MKTIAWGGNQITKAGLYSLIPLNVYHSSTICDGPSVSSSGLRRLFSKSPAHFYAEWPGNPNAIQPEDKKHFIMGRAIHHLMLGEKFFAKLFSVRPPEFDSWRSAIARDWRANEEKQGRAVFVPDDLDTIRGMARSLSQHPIVRNGALNGMIERSIFWKDKTTGLWLKARPDAIPTSSADFVDLKTTGSVLWNDLQRTILDCGYHQQGALIRTAAREVLGLKQCTFTLIFCEKTPPYCVRVVSLKDGDLDRGERQNRMAIDTVRCCLDSGHWPGPGGDREDAEYIELPEWSQKQIDEKLEFGI